MAKIRRMEQAGAVFTEDLSSITNVRKGGVVNGNPSIINGPVGRGMGFDATGDTVSFASDTKDGDLITTGDFSISVWIRTDVDITGSSRFCIISDKTDINNTTTGWMWELADVSGGLTFRYNFGVLNDSTINVATSVSTLLSDGNWHNLIISSERGVTTLFYVDGVQNGSGNVATSDLSNNENLVIGAYGNNSRSFLGDVSQVLIFDRALTAAEALAISTNNPFDYEKNVVSEWDMSNINPSDVGYRGLGNDGTGVNLTSANIVNGIGGSKAMIFNGSNEYIDLDSNVSAVASLTEGTISAWVRPDTINDNMSIILASDTSDASSECGLLIDSANTITVQIREDGTRKGITSVFTTTKDEWVSVIATVSSAGTVIYINGVEDNSNVNTEFFTFVTDLDAFRIGNNEDSGGNEFFLNGTPDKIKIFDRALTNLEVSDLYNKERGGRR